MAPIGTVIKNGIIFTVLSAPLLYLASTQFARGFVDLLYASEGGNVNKEGISRTDYFTVGVIELLLGFVFSIIGVGIVYMKTLSDTVEEGMIEF